MKKNIIISYKMINFFIFILITAIIYNYLQNIETFGLQWESNNIGLDFNNTLELNTTTKGPICMKPNALQYNSERVKITDEINMNYDKNNCRFHTVDWNSAQNNKLNTNIDKQPQIYNCLNNKKLDIKQKIQKSIFFTNGAKTTKTIVVPEKYIYIKLKNTKNSYLHLKDKKLSFKPYTQYDLSLLDLDLNNIKNSIKIRFINYAVLMTKQKPKVNTYYWDNVWTAVPVHWYSGHCPKGGDIIADDYHWQTASAQAKCKTGEHHNPYIIPTNDPKKLILLEIKNYNKNWNQTVFNLRFTGTSDAITANSLTALSNLNNEDLVTQINQKTNQNYLRKNFPKNFTITGTIEQIINKIYSIIDAQIVNKNLNENYKITPFCWEFFDNTETKLIKGIILKRFNKAIEDTYYKLTFNQYSKFKQNKLTDIKLKSKNINDDDKINILGFYGKKIINEETKKKTIKYSNSEVNIFDIVILLNINTKNNTSKTYGFENLEFLELDKSPFSYIKPTDLLTSHVCNLPKSKNAWKLKDNVNICPKEACYNKLLDECIEPPDLNLPKKCSKENINEKIKKSFKDKLIKVSDNQLDKEANKLLSKLSNKNVKIKENKNKNKKTSKNIKNLEEHIKKYHKDKNIIITTTPEPHNKPITTTTKNLP